MGTSRFSRQRIIFGLAVISTLAVTFSFGIHAARHVSEIAVGNYQGREKASDRSGQQRTPAQPRDTTLRDKSPSGVSQRACGQDESHNDCFARRSAVAAERQADSSETQAFYTLIGLLLLFGTLVYTARTAASAIQAVKVQIRSGGPFLHIERVVGGPSVGGLVHPVVRNIGKSPAVLIESFAECHLNTSALPSAPRYGTPRSLRRTVLDRDKVQVVFTDTGDTSAGKDAHSGVVWGYILYEDVFGTVWRRGYAFACDSIYVDEDGVEDPMWIADGGDAYNYDRKEDPKK